MKHGLTLVAGAALVLPLVAAAPAQAAGADVSIPSGPWSGEVAVQVGSDAPYLRFTLTGVSGTATEIVPNTGSQAEPITHEVPTWGFGESDNGETDTLTVAECTSATGGCTQAAQVGATVRQTINPTFTWEVPGDPLFVPEESIHVTMHGNPGGMVRMLPLRENDAQVLSNDTRTTVNLSNLAAGVSRWSATMQRCNPVQPTVCGAVGEHVPAPVVVGTLQLVSDGLHDSAVSPDPASPHASTTATTRVFVGYGYSVADFHGAPRTWELVNGDGVTVVGPVQYDDTLGTDEVTLDPAARSATRLPEGDYTVRYRVSITRGEMSREDTVEEPLHVGDAPPQPVSAYVQQQVRPGRAQGQVRFQLPQQYKDQSDTGRLLIRNSAGTLVRTIPDAPYEPLNGYFTAYWDGKNQAGVLQPVGEYQVTAEITDDFGQVTSTTVPLDIQTLRTTNVISQRERLGEPENPGAAGACASVTTLPNGEVQLRSRPCEPGETGNGNIGYNLIPDSGIDWGTIDRMIRVRSEVYGEGVPASSTMSTAWKFPLNKGSFQTSPDDLTGTLGWHYGGWVLRRTDTRGGASNAYPTMRLILRPTNGFNVRFVRARYAFREWYTPGA